MMKNNGKTVIGVTGGVGTGKSTVLEILKNEYGARVILADLVAHELMEPGSEGLARIVAALGDGFLCVDGSVDRKKFAALIFGDGRALETVNKIIHPLAWEEIARRAKNAPERLVIVEAAVFDTAPEGLFDEVWYVYATEENRIARLMENRGYTREKCESIIARQVSEESYRACSTRVIDNNGSAEDVRMQLKEIFGHEIH